jgi:hypothetical protein
MVIGCLAPDPRAQTPAKRVGVARVFGQYEGQEPVLPVQTTEPGYEFDQQQNSVFLELAGRMKFVGIAILIAGSLLFAPEAILMAESSFSANARRLLVTHPELALFFVLGGVLILMGANLYGAASHFKRIATTKGSDIDNLMVAMKELVEVYAVQRWLWIVVAITVTVAIVEATATR